MYDLLFSLHTFLLVIGALMVAGIYLWTGNKIRAGKGTKDISKHVQPGDSGKTRATDDHRGLPNSNNNVLGRREGAQLGKIDKPRECYVDDQDSAVELPVITRESDPMKRPRGRKRGNNQLELLFETKGTAEKNKTTVSQRFLGKELIILYIRAAAESTFTGPAIVRSMNNAGLRFGAMDIYHYFNNTDGLSRESPLFSVANMLEPGYFELKSIENFTTPGLAVFLQLPSVIDGTSAFELFLSRARTIAEILPGDLYGDREKRLDDNGIDKLRQLAAAFDDAH